MTNLPSSGVPASEVLAQMLQLRDHDVKWQEGKAWSLVYHAGDELSDLLKRAYLMYFSANALNPMAFPSLRRFEAEVVTMAASLLGGDGDTVGNMTSGGTESILLAVKTARDWARAHKPGITGPEMILPETAHPAFEKAAHYFGVKPVRTAILPDYRADLGAALAAITDNTILMVGSAPSYPQGVVDPIERLGSAAQEAGLLFHVDACVGGFMLPFARELGYSVPEFDFRVPGVTSISADLHKYAYAAKGASLILYRDQDLRLQQFFVYTGWSGGIYASPTMTGTRPGGSIAAAWAVMKHLGQDGYLSIAEQVMETTTRLRAGIAAIDRVKVLGDPAMSILALGSDDLNIYEIGDELAIRGWYLDRQQSPPSLHLTVTPAHEPIVTQFLRDLEDAVARVQKLSLHRLSNSAKVGLVRIAGKLLPQAWMSGLTGRASSVTGFAGGEASQRSAAMYGMMATLPNKGDLDEIVLDLLDQLTRLDDEQVSPGKEG